MKISWLMPFVAVGGSLVVSARGHAQPLFGHAESIECVVVNADLVFVGTLEKFDTEEPADGRGGREATMAVGDVLKEDIFTLEPYRRLRVRLPQAASVLETWKRGSRRLLVAVRDDAPEPDLVTVLDLPPGNLEVLTADFRLLRDPEAVLRAARDAVRRLPAPVKRLHTFRMMVPRPVIAGTHWESCYETGGYLTLRVPVDDRLEHRARDAIHSQDYLRREEGARALRYFKSDQNILELKKLINDPGWAYLRHPRENQGVEVRLYGVRQEAYRALKLWGLDVEEPPIREEIRASERKFR